MIDEALPAIEIDGFVFRCEFVMRDGQTIVSRVGQMGHVAQLLAALPDATRTALMLPHLPAVMVELRLANASVAALPAENAGLREELAHADRAHNAAIVALNTWWKAARCPDAPGVRDEATRAVHEYYRRAAPYLKERHSR